MTDKIITITSKNQITLPINYVRHLKLKKGGRLQAELKNGKIELKPAASLTQHLKKHWEYAAKQMKRPVTDQELRGAAREAHANAPSSGQT